MDDSQHHPGSDVETVKHVADCRDRISAELGKIIIGQKDVIEQLLIVLFCHGHALLVGVPGLAKTLIVSTMAKIFRLDFNRIQFTPDLMPADITGTDILEQDRHTGERFFKFLKGPVFANIILADEINRTPPKTQAALLQSMQEYRVTAGGRTFELKPPFHVFATQNPIEQEGTYPLPEAQLDRFMFQINVDYPAENEEIDIVRTTTSGPMGDVQNVLGPEEILMAQQVIERVPIADSILRYAVRLVRATRPDSDTAPQFVKQAVSWGAGPRASQCLVLGAKARAILYGRYAALIEDVRALAMPVLQHRVITNFRAEAEGTRPRDVITKLIQEIEP